MIKDFIENALLQFRLKWYPFIHSLSCDGALMVYVPNTDNDPECFMKCEECNAKYHLVNVEPDE